jgi:hypothetical protein
LSRLELFRKDPQNFAQGRYASSEELKRYFQAAQFLTKATFDVKIDKNWFASRDYMLFPFEAAVELLTKLANQENKRALDKLNQVSTLYDKLVGPSDLPAFQGLIKADVALTIDDVLRYAEKNKLLRINKQMGDCLKTPLQLKNGPSVGLTFGTPGVRGILDMFRPKSSVYRVDQPIFYPLSPR